jgi:hypothetical protein
MAAKVRRLRPKAHDRIAEALQLVLEPPPELEPPARAALNDTLSSYAPTPWPERALIATRTKAALRAAKERGATLGNLRLAQAREAANRRKQAEAAQTASRVMPVITSIRRTGATSLREIAAELEARGIRTPRGGTAWTATTVKRVIDRRAAA